jgi:dolichyl-phosphate-mannose--protein O-mannosyl transferase
METYKSTQSTHGTLRTNDSQYPTSPEENPFALCYKGLDPNNSWIECNRQC